MYFNFLNDYYYCCCCDCLLLVCSCGFQSNLHDRYGQLVALYTKLLCTKMEFHVKVRACVRFHTYDTKIHVVDGSKCYIVSGNGH